MAQIFVKVPFAIGGGKTAIPEGVQPGGEVSYTEGYGPKYSLDPVSGGGLRLEREQMNDLFYILTTGLNQYQTESVPQFITTADNGGVPFPYEKYATVLYDDGSGLALYQSLTGTNTSLPTVTADWRKLDPYNRTIERASPVFTGTPTAPTQSQSDVSDKLATTSFVKTAINNAAVPNVLKVKAKIVFNDTAGPPAAINVLESYNIQSIVREGNNGGQGPRRYTITFSQPLDNDRYAMLTGNTASSGGTNCAYYAAGGAENAPSNKTTTSVTVVFGTGDGTGKWIGEGNLVFM